MSQVNVSPLATFWLSGQFTTIVDPPNFSLYCWEIVELSAVASKTLGRSARKPNTPPSTISTATMPSTANSAPRPFFGGGAGGE